MKLPPLYTCYICGLEIRPSDLSSCRKAVVWLRSKGKTIHKVVEELHEYKHEFCTDAPPSNDVPLF